MKKLLLGTVFALGLSAVAYAQTVGPPPASAVPVACGQMPALTGDTTTSSGSCATTTSAIGGKSITLGGTFTTTPANNITLTTTGSTSVTLPTSGTLLTNALAAAHLLIGSSGGVATDVVLSGDAGMATSGAMTVSKVNGISYSSSAATGTLPIVTGPNTVTYSSTLPAVTFSGTITLADGSTWTSVGMRVNSRFNAFGTNLKTWTLAGANAIQLGNSATTAFMDDGANSYLGNNFYFNSAFKYSTAAGATNIQMGGTSIIFNTAASGSADATITFAPTASITPTGLVLTVAGLDTGLADSTLCRVTSTGAVVIGSGTIGICLGTSSARYKRDFRPLADGLDQIMVLKPGNYWYLPGHGDGGAHEQYGILAEDMQKVLPKLVGLDDQGRANTADLLGLVPVMVKAMQQQQRQITALQKALKRSARK